MMLRRSSLALFLFTLVVIKSFSQNKGNDWVTVPGFGPASPITLTSLPAFAGVIGLAALSYTLAEFVFENEDNISFYQVRAGMSNEYAWGLKNVWYQNFGVEHRVANWFSLAAAFTVQEFQDSTPDISEKDKFGIGSGIKTYYRWYLFGRKRLSPYFEYGTGLFYGFSKFPYNGTNFTFSHSTQIGLEFTLKTDSKIRFAYGNFHQSNYGWLNSNPAYDGNGFSLSYAW